MRAAASVLTLRRCLNPMPRRVAHVSEVLPPENVRAEIDVPWHTLSVDDTLERLAASYDSGLSPDEAAHRAARFGPNAIQERATRGPLRMLLDQFADFMILVLLAAAVVSGIVGDVKDTLAIVVIVVLNAVIGFVQEFRAERAMAAMKQMAAGNARVVRGGETVTVPATSWSPATSCCWRRAMSSRRTCASSKRRSSGWTKRC